MSNTPIVTSDLKDFGYRELIEVEKLIRALRENGLPNDFSNEDLSIMMNRDSGFVFFTNAEFQVSMVHDDNKLYEFFSCIECGNEGELEDICDNPEDFICNSCEKHKGGRISLLA